MALVLQLLGLASFALAQIGVDNVDVTTNIIEVDTQYLTEDPATFAGPIGVNTQYLTEENGVTKWIGVNTQYLTQITATTVDAQGSTVTSTQEVQATVIGDPPVNGVLGADLSVVVTPEFLAEINAIKSEFCPLKKRALTCGIEFLERVTVTFDIYAAAEAAKWTAAVGGIGAVGAMYAAQAKKIAEGGKDIPLKMDIYKDDFNKAKPVITKIITMTKSKLATPTISSSSASSSGVDGAGKPGSTQVVGPNACWVYTGSTPDTSNVENPDGDTFGDDDNGPPAKVKRLAGRVTYDDSLDFETEHINARDMQSSNPAMILKRGDITNLGSCPQKLPDDFKQASGYPSVTNVAKDKGKGLPHELWWFIPLPKPNTQLCTINTLQQVSGDQLQNGLPAGYDQQPASPAKKVSIDHIYEESFIKDFFSSVFTDPNDARCKPFLDMFLQQTKYTDPKYPKKKQYSRLQTLFFLAPSNENGAFVGLERNLNAVKGALMNPNLGGIQVIDKGKTTFSTDKNLNLWNDIAMAWSVLKIPAVQAKFKEINTNVYKGFLAIDKLQSCESVKGIGSPQFPQTWASAYQDWMTSFLSQRQAETIKYVASITAEIQAAPSSTTEPGGQTKNQYGHAFDALAAEYPTDTFYQLDTNALLDFSGDPIDTIQKRGNVIGFPACTAPPTSTALPTDLPKLSKQCESSSVVNCQWIFSPVTNTADCPTTTVTTLPATCNAAKTTPTARPQFSQTCTPRDGKAVGFPRTQALDAADKVCTPGQSSFPMYNSDTMIPDKGPIAMGVAYGGGSAGSILYSLSLQWSQDQTGCSARGSSHVSVQDCKNVFQSAVDNCDPSTTDQKYGSKPMTWSSPNGCIDVTIWASKES